MTLPPDFWDKPLDVFGVTGLLIGAVISFPLSLYLFPGGGAVSWQAVMTYMLGGVFMMAGMIIGGLVRLYWIGYF